MHPLLLTLFSGLTVANAGGPIVSLQYGIFQGAFDGNLSTFLGVPFAQPAYVSDSSFDFDSPLTGLLTVSDSRSQQRPQCSMACKTQLRSPRPAPSKPSLLRFRHLPL